MKIEFFPTRNINSVQSSGDTVRFRVTRSPDSIKFDTDVFGSPFELAQSTARQIESAWNADTRQYPCGKGRFVGGRARLIFSVHPSREGFWKGYLSDALSNSSAWIFTRRAA